MTRYICTVGRCKFSTILRKDIRSHVCLIHGKKGGGKASDRHGPLSENYKIEVEKE